MSIQRTDELIRAWRKNNKNVAVRHTDNGTYTVIKFQDAITGEWRVLCQYPMLLTEKEWNSYFAS